MHWYTEAYDPTNTNKTRAIGAIALTPTGNAQGGYFFMSLTTGRRLSRQQWDELPMPDGVIATAEAMAEAQGQPAFEKDTPCFEWIPEIAITDEHVAPIIINLGDDQGADNQGANDQGAGVPINDGDADEEADEPDLDNDSESAGTETDSEDDNPTEPGDETTTPEDGDHLPETVEEEEVTDGDVVDEGGGVAADHMANEGEGPTAEDDTRQSRY
jgi:hypothetical protein